MYCSIVCTNRESGEGRNKSNTKDAHGVEYHVKSVREVVGIGTEERVWYLYCSELHQASVIDVD